MSVKTELKKIWKILSESTNIPALILATTIGLVGIGFLLPILPVYLKQKGISFLELGYIISAAGAASMILKPFIGYFSDKFGRKIIIISSYFLQGALTPLYLVINNVTGLALVQAGRNAASSISQPTIGAMIGDVAPEEGRATLFGFYSSIQSFVYAAALFGGGILLVWGLQIHQIFYVTAGCLFISTLVLAIFLKETVEKESESPAPSPESPPQPINKFKRLLVSSAAALAERNSLGLILYAFFFMFSLAVYPIYISLFAVEVFGAAEGLLGPIIAVSWVTFAVVQPFGGWLSDWLGKRKILILIGFILLFIFNTALALSPTLLWMVVLWALIGVGDGMSRPVMNALIVDVVPPHKRGTYFGTLGFFRGLANITAPLVYGYMAEFYSIRWAFLTTSVTLGLSLLIIGVLIKEKQVIGE
ncbi:MAG: MFS transporter [Candidatus Methanofastidiosia archaeon]|jgi:MFS family permease